ncbi:hypothetical protein GQ42DRAFT_157360 [Ramicandelaber brevisporus]|nr:hypothetical protein GQ42DRAFT_157360 [Ramicandelaber brevisporus]
MKVIQLDSRMNTPIEIASPSAPIANINQTDSDQIEAAAQFKDNDEEDEEDEDVVVVDNDFDDDGNDNSNDSNNEDILDEDEESKVSNQEYNQTVGSELISDDNFESAIQAPSGIQQLQQQ